jgi:hypothetical protein
MNYWSGGVTVLDVYERLPQCCNYVRTVLRDLGNDVLDICKVHVAACLCLR